VFRVAFLEPRIPSNTGNAIRLSAITGSELHLIEPLGFELTDARVKRAGLDYHDMARVTVHHSLPEFWEAVPEARVIAFTAATDVSFADVRYEPGDVLLFGCEPSGLPAEVLADPRITLRVRIPMVSGARSMNLANAASIGLYEAWRQHGYAGAGPRLPADGPVEAPTGP
jgi:tRNA (cytidine/uridine-2'-O-)-methyltransferase